MSHEDTLSGQKSRILIVDDERFNLEALNALLRNDYKIMVATNGEQALQIAARMRPDLVLLDVVMPGMDGYEVCRQLKTMPETQRIPVIFVTAVADEESEESGFALGAVDYIHKPFSHGIVKARVSVHIQLKRKSDLLESLVSIDALTEIPNRRAYDQRLLSEWARALRTGRHLSMAMIDIDHFKRYNDQLGHGAGDDCLARVARALHACANRPGDMVARYGGEEFVGLFAETDLEGAYRIAERFHAALAALAIPHPASPVAPVVTVSIGIASLIPDLMRSEKDFSAQADHHLYQAKAGGRGRTFPLLTVDSGER